MKYHKERDNKLQYKASVKEQSAMKWLPSVLQDCHFIPSTFAAAPLHLAALHTRTNAVLRIYNGAPVPVVFRSRLKRVQGNGRWNLLLNHGPSSEQALRSRHDSRARSILAK